MDGIAQEARQQMQKNTNDITRLEVGLEYIKKDLNEVKEDQKIHHNIVMTTLNEIKIQSAAIGVEQKNVKASLIPVKNAAFDIVKYILIFIIGATMTYYINK